MSVATVSNNLSIQHGQVPKQQQTKKVPPTNIFSSLLSKEENEYLFSLLGERCYTLATAVVQLFLSEQPKHTTWKKKLTGVACFVKDNARKNYFIRVFDLDQAQNCVWQQQLYYSFQYKCPRSYFHTFEADSCMAALNFATELEADKFKKVIHEKVISMNQRRIMKKRENEQLNSKLSNQQFNVSGPSSGNNIFGTTYLHNNTTTTNVNKKKAKKDKKVEKKKYCKEDISLPTNFQHLHHVGLDSKDTLDAHSKLKEILHFAGVSENQLQDENTRDFIFEFIDKFNKDPKNQAITNNSQIVNNNNYNSFNGYSNRFNNQNKFSVPPPLPQSQPNYMYHSNQFSNIRNSNNAQQYFVQPRLQNGPASASIYQTKTATPPPPPPPLPIIHSVPGQNSHLKPPPLPSSRLTTSTTTPIPPPPPPPSSISTTSTSNNNTNNNINNNNNNNNNNNSNNNNFSNNEVTQTKVQNSGKFDDSRSALLDEIRQGKKLNKVQKPVSNNANSQNLESRDALLDQIRRGVELKSVGATAIEKPAPTFNCGGLAGALAKALQERSRALQPPDESSSSDSSTEEEWSD